MKWKAKSFKDENNVAEEEHDSCGFKTTRIPKPVDDLKAFAEDLINMVKNLEFRTSRSRFQAELIKTVQDIGKCKNLIIPFDKTANFYQISIGEYDKLLKNNITKNYEKCNKQVLNDINIEAKV